MVKPNVLLLVWRPDDKRPVLTASMSYDAEALGTEDGTWNLVSHISDLLYDNNVTFDPLNLTILCRLIS